ncbi:MAG TPA: sigma-70 family RNA polymerase sigma factor [Acidimicrobiales bacterium]|nr:sigma-70 family RNA polymerase sigma factor [Acidimicrobiales bacterium]
MTTAASTEGLLRELSPQVLGAVIRRYGDFAGADDAVQEALLAAATAWPTDGEPDNPLAWLIRVASRRMADQYRQDDARRRREDLAAAWSVARPEAASGRDDTLILMFMCCHPSLTPASAIPLTLRAVGGLTTREIAAAFLVPEATMAQRISRAKAKVKASDEPFTLPSPDQRAERLRSVLHVLYLLFNEGYASSSGPDLARSDLSGEAIRLTAAVHAALPEAPEVAGLLALMLLTDARRPARTRADGELVPLAEQDRTLWDRGLIAEGVALITKAMNQGPVGEYQVQAAIAAVHDLAARYADTDWTEILSLYCLLEQLTGNPMVTLNRAVAAAMAHHPSDGLALLDGLRERLGDHHRLHSVRAHLLELAGDTETAIVEFRAAAARTTNLREQHYLTTKAARLATAHPA